MDRPTDPNRVRLTGENSFMRLTPQGSANPTSRVSHWRVWHSPVGPGHVVFLQSEVTDGQIRIYADNIALARWLQGEIENTLNASNGDLNIPVVEATFSRSGDTHSYWTEYVDAGDTEVSLTWFDFGEPFVIHLAAGTRDSGPHGVYSTLIPARQARLAVNGQQAGGQPQPSEWDGHPNSSACLALSETWVLP